MGNLALLSFADWLGAIMLGVALGCGVAGFILHFWRPR